MAKRRYVSKREKEHLTKNEKWARFGKSLLKAGALTVGGIAAMTVSALIATPLLYVSAGVIYTLGSPLYGEVIMNFVDLFTKEKNNNKEM